MGIIRECGGKMHMSEGTRPVSCSRSFIDREQKTGRELRVTSLNLSATMTKQALYRGYKF